MSEPTLTLAAELRDDGFVQITAVGSLCVETYSAFETELMDWYDRGHPSVRLDFRRVDTITTMAAVGVISLLRVAQDRGGRIEMVELREDQQRAFRELELADLLPWVNPAPFDVPDEEE